MVDHLGQLPAEGAREKADRWASAKDFAKALQTQCANLLFDQEQRGKKVVEVPRALALPQQVKRSVNVAPNFLWDNSVYVLGLSELDETKPAYSVERFNAFRQLHTRLLTGIDSPAVRAVLALVAEFYGHFLMKKYRI